MQAIEVKSISCTNNKPDRLKAFCAAGNITKSINQIHDFLNSKGMVYSQVNRKWAIALMLRNKLWPELADTHTMHSGTLKNGNEVYVFVKDNERD